MGKATITGCPVFTKCFVACSPIEESQHPTCPQAKHRRRPTHRVFSISHSSHPDVLGDIGCSAATGATVIAAARWIKKTNNPRSHLIIAIPVAPKQTKDLIKKEADYVEVITSPSTSNFKSVGQYYQSFEALTDEQVIEIMNKRRDPLT